MTFGPDLSMTTVTHARGPDAHPFYRWLAVVAGFAPTWNVNKVLVESGGEIFGRRRATVGRLGRAITAAVEAAFGR